MAVKGLTFPEAWRNRVESTYADQPIHVLGLDDTIRAKKAAGRPQDLVDLKNLEARKTL